MGEAADETSPFEALRKLLEQQFRSNDPVGFGGAISEVVSSLKREPITALEPTARFFGGIIQAAAASAARLVGVEAEGPLSAEKKDNRFNDVAWTQNPVFYALLQIYLLASRYTGELVEAADLPEPNASKAKFATDLLLDAMSPTNTLFTNPAALRRAFDTGGRSVALGAQHFLHDLATNGGWPSKVPEGVFRVGENMAMSKGRVVYQNNLIELIQFEPSAPQVHSIPILFNPPWINKYYIMDLAPGKSLVEWSTNHGLTAFAISYRNPDSSMRDVSFDDYLFQGPRAAIEAMRSITGSDKVNTVSICLGGTLNAMLVAYLEATGEDIINSSTYLNTLVDHGDAGTLYRVFSDDQTVDDLVQRMDHHGYLEASEMSRTFDLLRANDLVFNYVASNWLMGEEPAAFDLLAWNNDSTRMPAKMHAYYLRKCWIENALARDEMKVGDTPIIISKTTNDSYFVAGVADHIVPWQSNYRSTQLFRGDCRFVMTSGGHIAGIVNPPNPKSKLWINDALPADPAEWLAGAQEHTETWWNDWIEWINQRSGELVEPPPMGNDKYPAGIAAPGRYVHS